MPEVKVAVKHGIVTVLFHGGQCVICVENRLENTHVGKTAAAITKDNAIDIARALLAYANRGEHDTP